MSCKINFNNIKAVIFYEKGPKIKLKGGQKDKIGNIEENNAVGVPKLPQYVI